MKNAAKKYLSASAEKSYWQAAESAVSEESAYPGHDPVADDIAKQAIRATKLDKSKTEIMIGDSRREMVQDAAWKDRIAAIAITRKEAAAILFDYDHERALQENSAWSTETEAHRLNRCWNDLAGLGLVNTRITEHEDTKPRQKYKSIARPATAVSLVAALAAVSAVILSAIIF